VNAPHSANQGSQRGRVLDGETADPITQISRQTATCGKRFDSLEGPKETTGLMLSNADSLRRVETSTTSGRRMVDYEQC